MQTERHLQRGFALQANHGGQKSVTQYPRSPGRLAFVLLPYVASAPCFGHFSLLGRSKEGRGSSKGSILPATGEGIEEEELSLSGWKRSVSSTFSHEGFRVHIPIGISSPVGQQAPAHIPDT